MNRSPKELARWWLARAKAGDQNASAVLYDLGRRVRGEIPTPPAVLKRLKPIYAAALALRPERARTTTMTPKPRRSWWPFGRRAEADFGADVRALAPATLVLPPHDDPEAHKPPVPPGTYDGLLDPSKWRDVCAKACNYRHGLAGAALVLSVGPALDAAWIERAMDAMAPTDAIAFFQATTIETRDPAARCVAMAKWIQRVKDPNRPIGGMVGWELGE